MGWAVCHALHCSCVELFAVQCSIAVWYVQCSIEMSCANHPLLLTTLLAALAITGLTQATGHTLAIWTLKWPLDTRLTLATGQ